MANIEILYDYENKEEIEEAVEVLIALGKLNYCVDTRHGKGYLKLKKVHQEVVSIADLERIASAEQKITDDRIINTKLANKPLEFPDHPFIARPALRVYYIGDEYIVAYSQFDAMNYIVKRDRVPLKDVEKTFKHECTPLENHQALMDGDFIENSFKELLKTEYPSGVNAVWIDGECYYEIRFDFIMNNLYNNEPFVLALVERWEDEPIPRVFYNNIISDMVEEYLSGEGE